VKERLAESSRDLRFSGINLTGSVKQLLIRQQGSVNKTNTRLLTVIKDYMNVQRHRIEMLDKKNSYLDPFLILNRGYSVTYYNGRVLKDPSSVSANELIETKLAKGMIRSKSL
jgi:exodeoxyribonuclease VII large subunit